MHTIDFSAASADDIKSFIAQAQAALANKTVSPATVRVAIEFGSYNARRYSSPWVAVVTAWPVGGRAELRFGSYLGNDSGGEAEINARPGQIVRWGQKDTRGNGTSTNWGVVQADGSVSRVTEAEARKAFLA